jgi:predicted P-loop ATPase
MGSPDMDRNLPTPARSAFGSFIGSTYYFLPPVDLFQDVLTDIAHLNKYHPVSDFLDNIKWDGNPRIDNWLHDYAAISGSASASSASRMAS